MEQHRHSMNHLFAQLGQPSDTTAIAYFIAFHRPLARDTRLPDAKFWSPTQAAFLREAILNDSDWAEVVEQLNLALHDRT